METKQKLYSEFLEFNAQSGLFTENDRILLGISGGIDSVVMLDLFSLAKTKIGIAHCNFQLRGDESDEDQNFVRTLADNYGIPFYTVNFNTREYAQQTKVSIQVAARELRYNWFRETEKKFGFTKTAVAHNKNDVVETFLFNLSRGTGIKGLTGIKPLNQNIIRPLLFAERKTIEQYSKEQKLTFREDSSNIEIKYSRNHLRHIIIPEFLKLNPTFNQTIIDTIGRLKQTEEIYSEKINTLCGLLFERDGGQIKISIQKLKDLKINEYLLFDILNDYQFTLSALKDILLALDGTSGKKIYSSGYRLIKDREYLIIHPLKPDTISRDEYTIQKHETEIIKPLHLKLHFQYPGQFFIQKVKNIATLDADLLTFPLILRKWKKGDYFYPFGLAKKKKISDYFTDHKFSIPEKENIWLLCSGKNIVWIAGHRIDDRYKITDKTKNIVVINYLSS
ncbi:MAG: tRNA lysidine(34) synthetase TilS [Bacteroidales bacterium]|nr:tRNA lysidine(34) synthetase TilS [Bacteroidales bacterium]